MQSTTHRRRGAVLVAGLTTLGLVSAGTLAAYTDTEVIEDNQFTAGHLDLVVGPTTTAITASGMAPGDTVTDDITVTNAGTIPLVYDIAVEQQEGSETLAEVLDLTLTTPEGEVILDQKGFPSHDTVGVNYQSRELAPGQSETVRAQVHMIREAGTSYADDSAVFQLTFDAVQGSIGEGVEVPLDALAYSTADGVAFEWTPPLDGLTAEYRYTTPTSGWVSDMSSMNEVLIPSTASDPVELQVRYAGEGYEYGKWTPVASVTSPEADSDLTDVTLSSDRVLVSWDGNGDRHEYVASYDGGAWDSPVSVGSQSIDLSVVGVGSLDLKARSSAEGPWTGSVSLRRNMTANRPGPAVVSSVSSVDDGSLLVEWEQPANTGGARITGYRIEATPASGTNAEEKVISVAGSATATEVDGLNNFIPYTVAVAAINRAGTGSTGPSATAMPLPDGEAFLSSGTWTVPDGVEQVQIEARGGRGMGDGGAGGVVVGEMDVTPGQTYDVVVGYGGGQAGTGRREHHSGYDGGGAADVRPAGGSLDSRLIVGAGGGGSGGRSTGTPTNASGIGGAAGGSGGEGEPARYGSGIKGKGGTQTSGYALGEGGPGSSYSSHTYAVGGGGGGGGYYGGFGSTGTTTYRHAGGGGGSSYIDPSLTLVSTKAGDHFGLPVVVITPIEQ